MKTTVKIAALLLAIALLIAVLMALYPPRTYHADQNAGIAWDWGGIEYQPALGVFICPASGHTESGEWVRDWSNPIAPYFAELVTDC